jgi:predicted transposase/invertase (TIGR01784 family)
MSLAQKIKEKKELEICEFRKKVLPKYLKIMEENENVKKAEENMEKLKNDEHAQYLAWLREKHILDMNSMKREGILIGREEGHAEGLEKGKKEVAKELLKAGICEEIIIQTTKLTKKELEKIKEEIEKELK